MYQVRLFLKLENIMKLALFDMDHTLVAADSSALWNEFLWEKKLISAAQRALREQFVDDYHQARLDIKAAYAFELEMIQALPPEQRLALREEYLRTKLAPFLTVKGQAKIRHHREQGEHIIIITATVDFIAEPVADYFKADTLIASRAEMIDGRYTGDFIPEPCIGAGKLRCFEHWLKQQAIKPTYITFYSDSQNDLPLLYHADKAIAVDPDPVLKKIAEEKNWEIVSFRE